jgi:hypothetical protein
MTEEKFTMSPEFIAGKRISMIPEDFTGRIEVFHSDKYKLCKVENPKFKVKMCQEYDLGNLISVWYDEAIETKQEDVNSTN